MSLSDAFNFVIAFQYRDMQIHDLDIDVIEPLKVAPSNYYRNLSGVAEMQIEGQEFVISVKQINELSFEAPKRGQVLLDPILGDNTISEVRPMMVMGNLIGYRVRTS